MARRRKHEDEHENHERWLVSYADFITLLFAFFVVMYSLSSINEGKYRIMSDSVVNAFRKLGVQSNNAQMSSAPIPSIRPSSPPPSPEVEEARKAKAERVKNMAEEIRKVLAPLVADGQVRVTEGAFGITVEINASVLFNPGEAQLGRDARMNHQPVAQHFEAWPLAQLRIGVDLERPIRDVLRPRRLGTRTGKQGTKPRDLSAMDGTHWQDWGGLEALAAQDEWFAARRDRLWDHPLAHRPRH